MHTNTVHSSVAGSSQMSVRAAVAASEHVAEVEFARVIAASLVAKSDTVVPAGATLRVAAVVAVEEAAGRRLLQENRKGDDEEKGEEAHLES